DHRRHPHFWPRLTSSSSSGPSGAEKRPSSCVTVSNMRPYGGALTPRSQPRRPGMLAEPAEPLDPPLSDFWQAAATRRHAAPTLDETSPPSPRESPRGSRRASDGESAASPPISPSAEKRTPRLTLEAIRASQLEDALPAPWPEQERPASPREQARESPSELDLTSSRQCIMGSKRPIVRLSGSPSPARFYRGNGARGGVSAAVPVAGLAGSEEWSAAAVTAAASHNNTNHNIGIVMGKVGVY
ncbi:hypothetical protein T492DRAFT_520437, partial [Pavlovales sp. CCMP2436]